MFDIGFWELSLVMIIALLVVGPERLPGLMRTLGIWVGRARRTLQSVQEEVRRELAAEELKRTLEAQKQSIGVHEIVEETRESLEEVTRKLDEELRTATAPDAVTEEPKQAATTHTSEALTASATGQAPEPKHAHSAHD